MQHSRRSQIQPAKCAGLFAQGKISNALELHLAVLGRSLHRPVDNMRDAIAHRANEEGGHDDPTSQGTDPQLVSSQKIDV